MTSIPSFGQGARASANAVTQFKTLKDKLGTLQVQLATGKTAATYGGLGAGAATSLKLGAQLSTLGGYDTAITDATTRVALATTGLQHVSDLAGKLGSDLASAKLTNIAARDQVQVVARGDLAEAIDVLNSDVNGRYLFSGRAADTEPVASLDAILNGADGKKGVVQLVTERKAADLGGGLGGLATSVTGATLSVGPETAGSAYGFTIASLTSTNPALGVTSTGTPPSATLNVTAQPKAGDVVSLKLNLPDGTTTTLDLTAADATDVSGNTFLIGATPAQTAANLKAALDTRLGGAVTSDLAAASTVRATTDFFNGAYPAGEAVTWYKGDDDPGSARETAPVQVGENQSVAIGLRANEPGLRSSLAALAALAVTSFASTGTAVYAPFNALASRTSPALLGSQNAINGITTDLAGASITLGNAASRVSAQTAHVQGTLDAVENATPEDVAAKLLAVQTQLQASYQTTAAIAKLSLTDYL